MAEEAIVEIRPVDTLTAEERQKLETLIELDAAVEELFRGYKWAEAGWYALARIGDEIVSRAKIVRRLATVGGKSVWLAGIGDVATAPQWRRRGFAGMVMREAAHFVCHELEVEFGLLFCELSLVPFYGRLGWQRVEGPTLVEVPWGRVPFPEETMVLACGEREWPGGVADLNGPPW